MGTRRTRCGWSTTAACARHYGKRGRGTGGTILHEMVGARELLKRPFWQLMEEYQDVVKGEVLPVVDQTIKR